MNERMMGWEGRRGRRKIGREEKEQKRRIDGRGRWERIGEEKRKRREQNRREGEYSIRYNSII